jgi:hypothetical protein
MVGGARCADPPKVLSVPFNLPRRGGIGPSAGAAASLVGAAIALSLLGAALLGARFWPGGPGSDSGRLTLPAAPSAAHRATSAHRVARRVVVLPAAASTPARHAARPHRRAHHPHTPAPVRRSAPPAVSARPAPAAPAPAASAPAPAAASSPARDTSPAAAPTPAPTSSPVATHGAVQQTVATVRHAAAPVADALPPAVQPAVQAAGDALQQTAATVDQALAPVTTTVDRTLAPVTGVLKPRR